MYVVRPQFFIPMITLLRNAATNSLKYKTELALVQAQNIDITQFESQLETFKTGFAKNYDLASRKFQTAIDEIDKSIEHLQKTKDALDRCRPQPAPRERQGPGRDDQEADSGQPDDGSEVRGT